jgi:hypothetical protein
MMQNRSHAVMAQRTEASDSLDNFPTPPWATRALITHVIDDRGPFRKQSCFEPACGAGHMAEPLKEYFEEVRASDIHAYGYGAVADFLNAPVEAGAVDWVVTNPPFRLAEAFVKRSLVIARRGVAILARTVFIESVGRYREIFETTPPSRFAQFTERVPMVKGRLDRKASTATGYAWLVWDVGRRRKASPQLIWIPPCRKSLERDGDYA